MSFSIVPLVNSIPGVENMSYLELGVWDGENHRQILSKDKVSVDIAKPADFRMSTDEFFEQNRRRFDIIFIDACHRLENGVRDYNNSILVCDRVIFMHDLFPDDACQVSEGGDYAGTVFRVLYHILRTKAEIEYYVLDGDVGMTIFFPPFRGIKLEPQDLTASYDDLLSVAPTRYNIPQAQEILQRHFDQ